MASDPSPVRCRPEAYQLFAEQVSQLRVPRSLLRAAVAVSMHELRHASFVVVEQQLDQWADEVLGNVRSREPRALLAHAHELMFEELGFAGNADDYHNPMNSYVPVVLETKRGLPITLCLVYRELLMRLGIRAHGIGSPGHFLAEVELPEYDEPMYIDCFHQGRALNLDEAASLIEQVIGTPVPRSAEALPRITGERWLERLLRNLDASFMRMERMEDAEAMGEMRQLLAPAD